MTLARTPGEESPPSGRVLTKVRLQREAFLRLSNFVPDVVYDPVQGSLDQMPRVLRES